MSHQAALTVRAPIRPGHEAALVELLRAIHEEGAADNDYLPFARLTGVHFGRLFVLEAATDLTGEPIPACLYYMCDVDGPAQSHVGELVEEHAAGLDAIFGHCEEYPAGSTAGDRRRWLQARLVGTAAAYVHSVGRSVTQVHDEERLRVAIGGFLDGPDAVPPTASAAQAHAEVRRFLLDQPGTRWARHRPRSPSARFRLREAAHAVLVPLAVLIALPVLLPATVVLLLVVRGKERTDQPATAVPTLEHIREREQYEDFLAQNPFTAVGFVKPGRVRRIVMRAVLLGLDYAARHVYRRDHLAGVRTIHFARWVPVDDGCRLIFASSYDGSLESYMDDFIDRLAWGLNAVFSNGAGWPRTRWLVLDGARDESAFKNYLRCHQVPTPVWYSAYGALPAANVDANAASRRLLPRDLEDSQAARWLARL